MLSYRHAFHAGNFADVHKHIVLMLLIQSLLRKDKPFFYLDTHAGIGLYDLHSEEARKTCEYEQGIARLWALDEMPEEVRAYLDIVRGVNGSPGKRLRYYPGSPRLARALMRDQDRMVLTELNPRDVETLGNEFKNDRRVTVYHAEGFQSLKSFLPPNERRGLVFVDPPYELKKEFEHVVAGLVTATQRWATGMCAVWYPILDRASVNKFHQSISATGIRKILCAELCIHADDVPFGLNGSGMLIINPPWQLDIRLQGLLAWLWKVLAVDGQGKYRVEWLAPE